MICWIVSVDRVDDLCLTNQIYSVLLNAFEFKEIIEVQNAHLKCFLKMTKRDLIIASTRHHLARLLKYYPRRPCAPSFVKLRIPLQTQRHSLLSQQIFFILVCIHAGNPGAINYTES